MCKFDVGHEVERPNVLNVHTYVFHVKPQNNKQNDYCDLWLQSEYYLLTKQRHNFVPEL